MGTLFLLPAVVGSGIMGEPLAGGIVAIALLANSPATGAALIAIILAFGLETHITQPAAAETAELLHVAQIERWTFLGHSHAERWTLR